jgi:hypothetical protein
MKKIMMFAFLVMLSFSAFSQKGSGFSVGLELGMPMGDFSNFSKIGFGGSAKYHHALSDKGNLTGTVGYTSFSSKTDGAGSTGLLAIKAGYQLKFDGGLYVEPQLGYGSFSGGGTSVGGLIYGGGVGYVINNMIDLSARYESVSVTGGTFSFIGIRAAYFFGGK